MVEFHKKNEGIYLKTCTYVYILNFKQILFLVSEIFKYMLKINNIF